MALLIEPMPDVPGVTRFATAASLPQPHLAVVGAIHGNERCGLGAITRLANELTAGEVTLRRGTLYLIHGNPAATAEHRRYTRDGVDLNRVFDYRFVDELAEEHWEHEHHRALELRRIFEGIDAVLDLHSATAPTPPFAIASRVAASAPFAFALGLPYVTFGWDGPGMLGDQVLLSQLTRRELPGVAVECGQHDDLQAAQVAYAVTRRALAYLDMADLPLNLPPAPRARQLVVRAAVKRMSGSFRFERPLAGMERLEPGTVIGHGDHLTLTVRSPCYAIMPNDDVPVGDDLLYIAEEQ